MPASTWSKRGFAAMLLAVLGSIGTPARAQTEVCIESTSALVQAIAGIDGSSTGAITLKLRAGTYTLTSDLILRYRTEGDPSGNYGKLTCAADTTRAAPRWIPRKARPR